MVIATLAAGRGSTLFLRSLIEGPRPVSPGVVGAHVEVIRRPTLASDRYVCYCSDQPKAVIPGAWAVGNFACSPAAQIWESARQPPGLLSPTPWVIRGPQGFVDGGEWPDLPVGGDTHRLRRLYGSIGSKSEGVVPGFCLRRAAARASSSWAWRSRYAAWSSSRWRSSEYAWISSMVEATSSR